MDLAVGICDADMSMNSVSEQELEHKLVQEVIENATNPARIYISILR
jgi:hypothetical protein